MKIICLWSGPRNISTALMYSFAQRNDTQVVDEPLYGHYLKTTGTKHPGYAEVLESMNCNGDQVIADLLATRSSKSVLFAKQMAHHLIDLDHSFLLDVTNIVLIRDPAEMLPSLTFQLPHASLSDTGLRQQLKLYEALSEQRYPPIVLDSRKLLLDPPSVISQLCTRLDIEFDMAMLEWPAGPLSDDGIWAKHWYHAVHKSTQFAKYQPKDSFPTDLEPLLEECRPYYEQLLKHAISGEHPQ